MRAVWSFWTKPIRDHGLVGWIDTKHHLFSWVLSVETARRHYPETSLITDDDGARMLIDRLGLPFENVSTALSTLESHNSQWYAMGKLYAYAMQTEPFVHIDGDVYLWNQLPERMERADVLAQNPEFFNFGASYYRPDALERALAKNGHGWIPEEWRWFRSSGLPQKAESCGIIGGTRIDFFNYYAKLAIKLIEHPSNRLAWSHLESYAERMLLAEQYLLSACIEYHKRRKDSAFKGINAEYLFDSLSDAFRPDKAERAGFTHLIAGAKSDRAIAARLEIRVKRDYPHHYERCLKYISEIK